MFENKRIAVLGAGKLGEALITGMIDAGIASKKQFIATAAHRERLEQVRTKLEIETTLSNGEAVLEGEPGLVCPEPQPVGEDLRPVGERITPQHSFLILGA